MINLPKLNKFLDEYLYFDKTLDVSKIDPYMTNGLMVMGREEIKRIGFGVSASLALFEKAKRAHCDVVIVHHSFNFPSFNRYDRIFQNRIAYLIKNDISLFGYHFLLDSHPEVGNNVQIIRHIGASLLKPYLHRGNPWGWVGEYKKEIEFKEVVNKINSRSSNSATIYPYGSKNVKKLVAVSGMGSPGPSVMHDLIEQNIDLYITGEVHEWNRELFREAGINFIAGGHYHTECFGIRALMDFISKHLTEVSMEWIDLPNDV